MTGTKVRHLDAYRQSAVNTASPLELIIMLYDGALRFLEMGRRAMRDGDLETQNENLTKAQRIITELSVSLDVEQGGEVAGNLLALYSYANNRLIEANISNDLAGVEETARLLSELRASWVELSAQSKREVQAVEAG